MRRTLLAAAIAASLAAGGCGDEDEPATTAAKSTATTGATGEKPPTEERKPDEPAPPGGEEAVIAVVEEVYDALEAGDYERMCELSSEEASRLAEKAFGSCEKGAEAIEPLLDIGGEKDFSKIEVTGVRIDGRSAEADWEIEDVSSTDELTYENGGWKLESPESAGRN